MFVTSCGGFKVGIDEETLDALEGYVDDYTNNDSESDNDSDEETKNSSNKEKDKTAEWFPTTDNQEKGTDRYFMGTYKKDAYWSYCNDSVYVPAVIRAYSHQDIIDFEDNYGDLVWIATIYQDETFDFVTTYANDFGQPRPLACTCDIGAGYYDYYNDQIECTCSFGSGQCKMYYDKM